MGAQADPDDSLTRTSAETASHQRYAWVRPLVVKIAFNALTLFIVIALLSLIPVPSRDAEGSVVLDEPLLDVVAGGIVGLAAFGLAFAVVQVIVQPLLGAIFGKFVIRTYGLLWLVVSTVLFWLAVAFVDGVFGLDFTVPDPQLVWLFVIAVIYSLLLLAITTLLGLNRPRLSDVGSDASLWRFIERLSFGRRSRIAENLRQAEVSQVLFEYTLDISLSGSPLGRFRTVGDRLLGRDPDEFDSLTTPAKVRTMLQRLGPTYVKVGQMVSSRADLLPEVWRDELERLQNDVPPVDYEQVEAVIDSELGAPPGELFVNFEPEPAAAASLAQVHRAKLPDGTPVAVKVQRPDIAAMVRADLGLIADLAAQGERGLSVARTMNLSAVVKEFGDGVLLELDYGIEAYHALRLAEVLDGMEGVHVPQVYLGHSAQRVITMEWITGVKLTTLREADAPGVDRDLAARRLMRAMVKQLLISGFFHADPHPGNILIDPETGTLTFLDLGLMGELDSAQRIQVIGLLLALRERDPRGLATALLGVSERHGPVDESSFRRGIERVCYQYWIYGTPDFSRMMSAIFGVLAKHNLRLDPALTLAVKALIQSEELITTLGPNVSIIETMYEETQELIGAEITPDAIIERAKSEVSATVMEIGKRIPSLREATFSWLDQYQRGKFVVTIDTGDLQKGLQSVGSVSRNLTVGLVIAGQLVALALVLAVVIGVEALRDDLMDLLIVAFVGFLAFSIWMIRKVWREGR